MKNFIFVGMLFLGLLASGVATVSAESGTEECDAVAVEQVLKQARGITASAAFLPEIRQTTEEAEAEVKKTMPEPSSGDDGLVFERKEYDEAIRRYWGTNSRSNPKND